MHPQQRFGGCRHFHPGRTSGITELIPWLQGPVPWQLQQHLPATVRAATATHNAAFIRRERQQQISLISPGGKPLIQNKNGLRHPCFS